MRIKQIVNKLELQSVINGLENSQEFPNLSALFKAVAETPWAKGHDKPLTPSVVALRVREFGITPKTQPGKRGRPIGTSISRGPRTRQKKSVGLLAKVTPERYTRLVERIASGSKASALKLKCLECSAYQPKEIRECPVKTCALWNLRPFQKNSVEAIDNPS